MSASIEDQIASMMYQTENKKWRCAICNQESIGKTDITRHVESKHIENHPGYACGYCDYVTKSRNASLSA